MAPTGQSIVDVTMSTPGIADMVKHWATVDYVPSTDHVLNEFMFLTDDCWTPRPAGYNIHQCDWSTFTPEMEGKLSPIIGTKWRLEDLDVEGEAIHAHMHEYMRNGTISTNYKT